MLQVALEWVCKAARDKLSEEERERLFKSASGEQPTQPLPDRERRRRANDPVAGDTSRQPR